MKYIIHGEGMEVTNAISDYVKDKIGKVEKYIKNNDVEARVIVKSYGRKHVVEVTIPYDKFIIRAEVVQDDLYAAIDKVIDRLERQIRKNKTKLKRKNTDSTLYFNFDVDSFNDDLEEDDNDGKIVKRKKLEMKPMDSEEAILEMELLGHDFFIYKDMDTNNINVIYKRKDGDYGIIETN